MLTNDIGRECRRAKRKGEYISDACAREIVEMFGTGDALPGIFMANGAVPDGAALWAELFPLYERMNAFGRVVADELNKYLTNNHGRGPVDGWRQGNAE
ncbi:MAG: hypothetical protein ACREP9_06675 [Candidatus Dormibacteraceae bacterium]